MTQYLNKSKKIGVPLVIGRTTYVHSFGSKTNCYQWPSGLAAGTREYQLIFPSGKTKKSGVFVHDRQSVTHFSIGQEESA